MSDSGWISEDKAVHEPGEVKTTLWWGDKSIDREASGGGINEWCWTGETDHLVRVAGFAPRTISYRPLSGPQAHLLPLVGGFDGWLQATCYMAFRLGCEKIDGVKMVPGERGGFRLWSRQTLTELSKQVQAIPIMGLHRTWLQNRMPGSKDAMSDADIEVRYLADLPQWLGALILGATFRT